MCIPLESIIPFLVLIFWNPIAKLLGWEQKEEKAKKVVKEGEKKCCTDGTSCENLVGGSVNVLETKEQFDAMLDRAAKEDKLALVKFTALWCGPCQAIKEDIKKLAAKETDVYVAEVDVDENDETAADCGIAAMPTFQWYRNGKKIKELRGANASEVKRLTADFNN